MSDSNKTSEKAALAEKEKEEAAPLVWKPFLFPERCPYPVAGQWSKWDGFTQSVLRNKCESAAYSAIVKSDVIRMMVSALRTSGCTFDLRRNLCCSYCAEHSRMSGGYDPLNNQIVLCQQMVRNARTAEVVIAHELVHMFDNCRAELDFDNPEHLACTEIRAANLMHCHSHFRSWLEGNSDLMRSSHAECVKRHAIASVSLQLIISEADARPVVERVFDRCYADLEPFGRHFLFESKQPYLIYNQRRNYGYY